MDLPTLLSVITTVAVVVGVAFGIIEIRQALRARRDQAAVEIVRAVESSEVRLAIERVMELPVDCDPQVVNGDPQLVSSARLVFWAAEMYGSIVFEGVISLQMLDRIDGGWLRSGWVRLRRWIEGERSANPNTGEWWQWLYDMLEAHPDPGKKTGAHNFYRGRLRG
jgi:hypothetical protein